MSPLRLMRVSFRRVTRVSSRRSFSDIYITAPVGLTESHDYTPQGTPRLRVRGCAGPLVRRFPERRRSAPGLVRKKDGAKRPPRTHAPTDLPDLRTEGRRRL